MSTVQTIRPPAAPAAAGALAPARLDLLQSATGLLLALFLWGHMFFVSSILVSERAMWTITKMFEGRFLFGRSIYLIVSVIVAGVIVLFVAHAVLAMRKLPINVLQFREFRSHMRAMHHGDTTLWFVQAATGVALFFLATIHLYVMLLHPDRIGPFESADRVWSDGYWPLYLVLLFVVELHGGIGLYRLCLKWGWSQGADARQSRRRLAIVKWCLTAFFIVLGLTTLTAYMRIGYYHSAEYGQPYSPPGLEGRP